ncbi:MAG: D-glycero-beta-D-manno-heptose 1-phosphate adenylyltransferase [Candidatus Omnitrophota bacterium]
MSGSKIKSLKQLSKTALSLKSKGKKIVFTNGCFDILHFGHVYYLQQAKKQGDILIVGLNSDTSIKRIKGKNRPIVCQQDRAKVLAGLESVDYIVIFNEDTPLKTISAIKPDVLIKGSDWQKNNIVGSEVVSQYGGKVATIKLAKGRSTTNIIEKIISHAIK